MLATTKWFAAAGAMVNAEEAAPARLPSLAFRVYPPAWLMDRLVKTATPLWACACTVPLSVPLLRVRLTVELSVVTTLPAAFSTDTCTPALGSMVCPAVVAPGWLVNASLPAELAEAATIVPDTVSVAGEPSRLWVIVA